MPAIELDLATAAVVAVLLIIAAYAVAFFVYRRTTPPVSNFRRWLLTLLRGTALAIILILLFEPLVRLTTNTRQQPVLAVLVDESQSMHITDRTGDRARVLHEALSSAALRRLEDRMGIRFYGFGTALHPMNPPGNDTLALDDESTDMARALRDLAAQKQHQNVTAAVLLTDGSYNVGRNPVYEADELGIPVFTVGIGDSSEQKDLLVARVAANQRVYSETSTPVDVTLRSTGFGGQKVEVTLTVGSRELSRATVTLGEGTREYAVQLTYEPQGEGVKQFAVQVSRLPGELTYRNNRKTFQARVLRSKQRVAIIAGGPSPDVSIVDQTLKEDPNVAARTFTQRRDGGFYGAGLNRAALDSSDCLLLVGFPTAQTSGGTLSLLRELLERTRKPVMYIGGHDVDYRRAEMLGDALPFMTQLPVTTEQYVLCQPANDPTAQQLLGGTEGDLAAWADLPPIFSTLTTFRPRPGAFVIAQAKTVQGAQTGPLILGRSIERQKSIAITGYGIWRWRLMSQGHQQTSMLLSSFLSGAVKWLTTAEDTRPVRVTPTQESFVRGEPVTLEGEVHGADTKPVEQAQLRVTARQGEQVFETELRPLGNGRYEGSFEGLPEGDYTFEAQARLDSLRLGGDRGRFTVGGQNLEFQDTRMNASLLQQLARRTGGAYFSPQQMDALASTIASSPAAVPRIVTHHREIELWHWVYALAAVVLLLSVEWLLRRRSGMM